MVRPLRRNAYAVLGFRHAPQRTDRASGHQARMAGAGGTSMITVQLVAEAIERLGGDKHAYRIAGYIAYRRGHAIGSGDMHAIRDILGGVHPDLHDDAKPVQASGRRDMSRTRTPSHKGEAL